MLTVRDIANLPGLGLGLAAGAAGADNPIGWVHVSELPDPTPWLEGGELLITTGLEYGPLTLVEYFRVGQGAEAAAGGVIYLIILIVAVSVAKFAFNLKFSL